VTDSKIVLVIKNVDLPLAEKIQNTINMYNRSKVKGDRKRK